MDIDALILDVLVAPLQTIMFILWDNQGRWYLTPLEWCLLSSTIIIVMETYREKKENEARMAELESKSHRYDMVVMTMRITYNWSQLLDTVCRDNNFRKATVLLDSVFIRYIAIMRIEGLLDDILRIIFGLLYADALEPVVIQYTDTVKESFFYYKDDNIPPHHRRYTRLANLLNGSGH